MLAMSLAQLHNECDKAFSDVLIALRDSDLERSEQDEAIKALFEMLKVCATAEHIQAFSRVCQQVIGEVSKE